MITCLPNTFLAGRAMRLLAARGMVMHRITNVDRAQHLGRALDAAVAGAPDLLVVAGGDGTLSAAGRRLSGLDIALGVLPVGTTNNFARSLGLPVRLEAAVAALAAGKVADVDLGAADERAFTNMVSVGVSVQVAGRVPYRLNAVSAAPLIR